LLGRVALGRLAADYFFRLVVFRRVVFGLVDLALRLVVFFFVDLRLVADFLVALRFVVFFLGDFFLVDLRLVAVFLAALRFVDFFVVAFFFVDLRLVAVFDLTVFRFAVVLRAAIFNGSFYARPWLCEWPFPLGARRKGKTGVHLQRGEIRGFFTHGPLNTLIWRGLKQVFPARVKPNVNEISRSGKVFLAITGSCSSPRRAEREESLFAESEVGKTTNRHE